MSLESLQQGWTDGAVLGTRVEEGRPMTRGQSTAWEELSARKDKKKDMEKDEPYAWLGKPSK